MAHAHYISSYLDPFRRYYRRTTGHDIPERFVVPFAMLERQRLRTGYIRAILRENATYGIADIMAHYLNYLTDSARFLPAGRAIIWDQYVPVIEAYGRRLTTLRPVTDLRAAVNNPLWGRREYGYSWAVLLNTDVYWVPRFSEIRKGIFEQIPLEPGTLIIIQTSPFNWNSELDAFTYRLPEHWLQYEDPEYNNTRTKRWRRPPRRQTHGIKAKKQRRHNTKPCNDIQSNELTQIQTPPPEPPCTIWTLGPPWRPHRTNNNESDDHLLTTNANHERAYLPRPPDRPTAKVA